MPSSSTHARTTSHPPPNVPDGGGWGKVKYQGDRSCLFGVIFCFFTCCPIWMCLKIDNKDAYLAEGKVYDAAGTYLGTVAELNFIAKRDDNKS
mmetsp:Transcript_4869/g.4634  ORF Transcript_4869/g.4634 Transcript_4869/m.4634 type:complete len:93 (-) Transcript_4869:178-456(-)